MCACPRMLRILLSLIIVFLCAEISPRAQNNNPQICQRPTAGSSASEPEDLRSDHGVLKVTLKFLTAADPQGHVRYCYVSQDGAQAPTLRVNPGDTLILNLENDIAPESSRPLPSPPPMPMQMQPNSCSEAKMTASSTNLHFHGLMIPPLCHQDDVLHTVVGPSSAPFEYRFQIPDDQPPGLYWYHPHLHGFT